MLGTTHDMLRFYYIIESKWDTLKYLLTSIIQFNLVRN